MAAHTFPSCLGASWVFWHSVLAAVFSAVATAIIFNRVLGKPEGVAWLAGAFMFAGFITHLTLDEIYSVDVMDTRIKSSFGTALKLFIADNRGFARDGISHRASDHGVALDDNIRRGPWLALHVERAAATALAD